MPRIDIELTSSRPDGSWTWRAAGALKPKGVVAASMLHEGAKVGDVVRADAEIDIDGISVTAVTAPKAKKAAAALLPLLGSGKEEALVTHSPLKPGRDDGDDRGRRGDRNDRFGGGGRPGGGRPGGRPGALPGGPGTTRPRASAAAGTPPRDGVRRDVAGGGAGRPDRPRRDREGGGRPPAADSTKDQPTEAGRGGRRPAGERTAREGGTRRTA